MEIIKLSLISFSMALVMVLGFGSVIIKFSKHIGLVNVPFQSKHNINPKSTPLAGGLILFFSFFFALIIGLFIIPASDNQFLLSLIISATIILAFGIWDDLKGLNATTKLLGQFSAVVVFLLMGNSVELFQEQWLNVVLTFLWLIGITNAFNLIDSREGIVTGISVNTLIALTIASFVSKQDVLIYVSMTLLGTCIGMKFFNSLPGRTFLGDSGAQTLGFITAALTMAYNPIGYEQTASWFLPILLFSIPLFDTSLVVITRLIRGKHLFKGDTNHTYHRLSRIFNENEAINLLLVISILYDGFAFLLLELNSQISSYLFGIILLASIYGGVRLVKLDPGIRDKTTKID